MNYQYECGIKKQLTELTISLTVFSANQEAWKLN